MGDFNMTPASHAHALITSHSPVRDVWRLHRPGHCAEPRKQRITPDGRTVPYTAAENIDHNGITSGGPCNTWRWPKDKRARLAKGEECPVDPSTPDTDGQRLDYIFVSERAESSGVRWNLKDAEVVMTQRHPTLLCSLSDHFGVRATLTRSPAPADAEPWKMLAADPDKAQFQDIRYVEILNMIAEFTAGERVQQKWRARHFYLSVLVWVGCLVAVWFSPHNFVAFILLLIASLGLASGVVDGLIALIFFQGEFKALREFEWEISNARALLRDSVKQSTSTTS